MPSTSFTASVRLQWIFALLSIVFLFEGCGRRGIPEPLSPTASLHEKLDQKLKVFHQEFDVPGMQLGVVKNGKVAFAGSCGVRSLETNSGLTSRSLFHMASLSKPFVALAILQLAEIGKLSLEDRIVAHLPYFSLSDERYSGITIKQVLTHTSGLPDVRDYQWDKPQWDEGAAERYVRSLSGLKLRSNPGERFNYSNIGYDILGDLIAKASGMSFEAHMKANIFKPMEMSDSTFLKSEVPPDLSVSPHRKGFSTLFIQRADRVNPYHRAHSPSSTLHSNVGDMLNFCQVMLENGKFKERSLLQPASLKLAWTEHADQGLGDPVKAEWMGKVGFGWFLGSYRGHRMISFVGADPGFRSSIAILPDSSIAVVTMGNSDGMKVGRIVRAALDLALE